MNSHLVVVPPGASTTSTLQSSPIMGGTGNAPVGGGGGGGFNDFDMYGGINPNDDPEYAMAIRISQEEAKAAEEARMKVSPL